MQRPQTATPASAAAPTPSVITIHQEHFMRRLNQNYYNPSNEAQNNDNS